MSLTIVSRQKLSHPPEPRIILISMKSRLNQLTKPLKLRPEITLQASGKAMLKAIELVSRLTKEYRVEYEITSFTVKAVDNVQIGLDDFEQKERNLTGIKIRIWKI